MTPSPVPARQMLLIPLGFIIWSAGFVTLYAMNAIGCEFSWPGVIQRAVLIGLALGFLAIAALAGLLVHRHWKRVAETKEEPAPSLALLGLYGMASGFVALIGVLIPTLATTMCI